MTATPQDVQAKIDAAMAQIKQATSAPAKMVAAHGPDPANWTSGHLKTGFIYLLAARGEAGQLTVKTLRASFTSKEG